MGRKVVFSAMLAAGLVQMAPASAQQDKQQDVTDAPAEAAAAQAAPVQAAPAPAAPEPAKAVEARPVEAKPAPAVVAEAKPREPDLADKDLAMAPPEELPPVRVDPNKARHGLASLNRPSAPREKARPVMAAAERAPEPVQAESADDPIDRLKKAQAARMAARTPAGSPARGKGDRDAASDVAVAERIVEQAQAEHGGEAGLARSAGVAARPRPAVIEEQAPEAEPAIAAAEEAPPPVEEAREVTSAPIREARDVASAGADVGEVASAPIRGMARLPRPSVDLPDAPPVFAGNGRRARPDLAEERDNGWDSDDRAVDRDVDRDGGVYAQDDRDPRDAAPEDDRAPVYADNGYGRPTDGRDYEGRGDEGRGMRGRAYPERRAEVSWPDRNRYDDRTCDNARAVLLQQRVRREAARGLLDRRAARDIDDEIVQLDDLHRSYCASGMNDWREERLERQFTEIEDRIRFEEGRTAGAL